MFVSVLAMSSASSYFAAHCVSTYAETMMASFPEWFSASCSALVMAFLMVNLNCVLLFSAMEQLYRLAGVKE